METCCVDGFVSLNFFFLDKNCYWPKFTFWPKLTGIGQNDPKLAGIGPKVEHVVLPFQIASRYEIFRPFQLEQNGFNNIGSTNGSTVEPQGQIKRF